MSLTASNNAKITEWMYIYNFEQPGPDVQFCILVLGIQQ
jgi:hypothetical protein